MKIGRDEGNRGMKNLTINNIYKIEAPFLYSGRWTTQGGMYNVLENGMVIARCPSIELSIRVAEAMRHSGADLSGANLSGEKIDKIPMQICGLLWWINITKIHIQIGCEIHKAEEWFNFTDKEISRMHEDALVWWKANKGFIKSAWEHHCKD